MESWMYASQQDMSQDQLEGDATSGTGTRRSYDCSFCKRGFTNAQALGGHMNIHRKERAKKSKNNGQSSTSRHLLAYDSGNSEHYPYQYPSSVPVSEPLNYPASAAAAGFDGYGVCWSSTSGMPAQPCGMMGDVSSGMNLVVGSRAAEVYDGYEVQKGYDDVDLELRL